MNLILFIGALAALIIIHEAGHFVACRIFKIEVEEFGLGFPPRAAKLFTWKGTLFSLNWIPLGGFVKPKGENDPESEGGLAAAKPWVRIAVYAAGPIANLITAAVLYTIIFAQIGTPDLTRSIITAVNQNSPAQAAGLQVDDLILQINDVKIDSPNALVETVGANAGEEIVLLVQRGDRTFETSLTPRENPPEGEGAIGIGFSHPGIPAPLWQSASQGVQSVALQIYFLATLPSQIKSGAIAAEDAQFVGYKGMYNMFEAVREEDARNEAAPQPSTITASSTGEFTLRFFAFISISLGVLNLFPVPALDGGRILFTLPEIFFRKRIPPKFENAVNLVSFGILLMLMIYINVQDFVNPIDFTFE